MGTQFTSRIKLTDRERIYKGLKKALADEMPTPARQRKDVSRRAGNKPSIAPTIKSLSQAQRRRFGEAAVSQVLNVYEDHNFFSVLEINLLFADVLKWLQRLRSDAEFNGFTGIILEYTLETSDNPVRDLARKLEELTSKSQTDLFRVACTNAAKAILAETSLRNVSPQIGEIPARTFGRKIATLDVRALVKLYIQRLVYEVLSKPMSMSDPASSKAIVQQAIDEIKKTTERIAKKAVEQVIQEGKLNDPSRIHRIVIECLMAYKKPEAA